jgi:hypothetical protein
MRRPLRSVGAVVAGLAVIVAGSLATDQLLHTLGVYPPWGEPMFDTGLNLLALGYRAAWTVLGGWVAARLAPRAPVAHAIALGAVGLVLGVLGAVGAWGMSPGWFLVAVAVTGPICAWAGGLAYAARPARPGRNLGET